MTAIDLEDHNNKLIIVALVGWVVDGMTVEDAYERLEEIKNHVHFALKDAETRAKQK